MQYLLWTSLITTLNPARLLTGAGLLLVLAGCTTYGERNAQALHAMEQGDLATAETLFEENLSDSNHQLLYAMELGTLRHLGGDFEGSNQYLEQADQLRDSLMARSRSEQLADFLSSPSAGPYRGSPHEFAYVNYHKALNFLALAQNTGDPRWLDAARVEARRLDIILNEFAANEGSYLELAQEEDDEDLSVLARVIQAFQSSTLDHERLIYRDDAWGRFLSGVAYENQGEWDNARVSYEQAARAYESGYADQYDLGEASTRLAWTSAVRMMRTAGGYGDRWPPLVEDKNLDEADTRPLGPDEGMLLVIEHAGRVAPVGELNLYLYQRPEIESLVIRPVATDSGQAGREQLAWFTLHYSDRGVADLVSRYMAGGVFEVLNDPLLSKQIYIGPLWELAETSGLLGGIGQSGMRVSVPWYPPARNTPQSSEARIGTDQRITLSPVANIEGMKRQERLRLAQDEINMAILREFTRNTAVSTASNVTSQMGDESLGMLVEVLGRIGTTTTARAETRHWATLPRLARANLVRLPAGEHAVTVTTAGGRTWQDSVDLTAGRVNLTYIRTFDSQETR